MVTHSQGAARDGLRQLKTADLKPLSPLNHIAASCFRKANCHNQSIHRTFGELKGVEIPLADFEKLTKIPIVIYYGDNIAKQPTKVWNMDH
ncbi:hypothetical protein KUH03_02885 [Sphingobacterium sp. E70]|uniref:hypothetical protein n=1 Tax=Sphingobacterium sp. E70 TaxID=2853439 RepID=UPI00211C57C1|nr:hypothetical protein [Sphingobacterium sp. E70]ULT25941.1 hypothetical protein KUH03_02885 [Sphingobacterium sp. E70]